VDILVAPNTVDDSVQRRLDVKISNMARVLEDDSLHVEPEIVELDSNGFDAADLTDFLGHVTSEMEDA
jgi:hypothetical protein